MSRADRLELTLRLLRDRPGITAAEIAERLGTSTRNVFRDLAALRDRGHPVEASRGRGGGLRLHPNWGLGRIQLSAEEALGVLLGLAVSQALAFPMFGGALGPARTKIVHAFPSAERQRLKGLRERVLVGAPASDAVRSSYGAVNGRAMRELERAFVRARVVRMEYRKPGGAAAPRDVEPHALLLNWPVWYVLAFDRTRDDARTFRLDRIESVRMEPAEFRPRARAIARDVGVDAFADPERLSL